MYSMLVDFGNIVPGCEQPCACSLDSPGLEGDIFMSPAPVPQDCLLIVPSATLPLEYLSGAFISLSNSKTPQP